jgi:hypothetical protein
VLDDARGAGARGSACGGATLEKAAAGGPCDGEGEWHCFFRSHAAATDMGSQSSCIHALEDEGERRAERIICGSCTG